ncbi:MAG: hypothetical protein IT260_19210 [Saprospiraceae bacterium]|nr:hypothetical protein [Saprospiraceae bacterium]
MRNTDFLRARRQPSWTWPLIAGLLLLAAGSPGCRSKARQLRPAFYHWQTQLDLSATETALLDSTGCQTLFVKLLDIGKDPASGDIRPYSLLRVGAANGWMGKRIVGCAFLTNEVFKNISAAQTDALAQKTAEALLRIGRPFWPADAAFEIQFDCDWTGSTRAAYFSFLNKIRPLLPKNTTLSATIRLHQYKFPNQTGVPPTDRGMLMLYNTGDIDDWAENNSIFETAAAQKYLQGAPDRYPLPLDVALPLFAWALVYRDDELWKIIPEPDLPAFADTSRFEPVTPDGWPSGRPQDNKMAFRFGIRKSTFLGGHYLRPGDLIRVERIDSASLREAAQLAAGLPLATDAAVAFFHLDSATVHHYPAIWLKRAWETIQHKQ